MHISRLALALTLLPALPVQAAIYVHPCEQARQLADALASAVTVIQIADHKVEWDGQRCRVTGTVVRSFRGSLEPGTLVQTSFRCGEASTVDIIHNPEEVARAAVLELHAHASGGPTGGNRGLIYLDAPTDEPVLRVEMPDSC